MAIDPKLQEPESPKDVDNQTIGCACMLMALFGVLFACSIGVLLGIMLAHYGVF